MAQKRCRFSPHDNDAFCSLCAWFSTASRKSNTFLKNVRSKSLATYLWHKHGLAFGQIIKLA
eukprot:6180450-Pleurochrysis_carterae.AAC.4